MTLHVARVAGTAIVGIALGFWLYGVGRTMRETVHFSVWAMLSGILLSVLLPTLAAVLLRFLGRLSVRAGSPWPWLLTSFTVSLVVGSGLSEAWILRDESRFENEAARATTTYSRPRAWPNQGCSLVFIPGKGIHSTD